MSFQFWKDVPKEEWKNGYGDRYVRENRRAKSGMDGPDWENHPPVRILLPGMSEDTRYWLDDLGNLWSLFHEDRPYLISALEGKRTILVNANTNIRLPEIKSFDLPNMVYEKFIGPLKKDEIAVPIDGDMRNLAVSNLRKTKKRARFMKNSKKNKSGWWVPYVI